MDAEVQKEEKMNLQQMKYVLSIATHGTFSKAAQELYLTQPTLSNEIKKLEKEIGINIFQRGKTGAVLTEDGREFLEIRLSQSYWL